MENIMTQTINEPWLVPGFLDIWEKHRNGTDDIWEVSEANDAEKPGQGLKPEVLVRFRVFQKPVFEDRKSGVLVLHWSRQIGKSFTLAAWAVDRLLTRPGRLVTVLSNSRDNGAEFLQKCAAICDLNGTEFQKVDKSPSLSFRSMRMELRIRANGRTGRIKVLAANPRTARGFSGDLILDEFAFHENSAKIWEAAEPILASHPDYLCRIASTGNGKHNLFYRIASLSENFEEPLPETGAGVFPFSRARFRVSRVPRSEAWRLGVLIYDPQTRLPITPEEAREAALDKRAYDQNYECAFEDENMTLLSHELISAAERPDVGEICEQDWTESALERLRRSEGRLFIGVDVGRKVDLTVFTVVEAVGDMRFVRAILRIKDMRLPDQQMRLAEVCRLHQFCRASIDMTGLGLGLFEYVQNEFSAVHGINFASTVPATECSRMEGRKQETVRVTEALAMELLQTYEERRIQHPTDLRLRDDLRKPEKVTSPGGRVSIAATRSGEAGGHADHFWSLALALEAAGKKTKPWGFAVIHTPPRILL
jgi:phage FluMu gp28-like protein